ncbi:hypothetical protein OBK29_03975 [Empedobacter falsenii]|uniref:hypothetical protein n=1 Tax=Empedobacter falsenii TaxID=343874 RepID=UPI003A7FECAF
MAKVTITKTLVEKNSQLAELLAERNIEVGSKIEQSELDELYKVLEKPKSYKVISRFRDQNNEAKIYEVNEVIPADFEESRIASLLERKLISEA